MMIRFKLSYYRFPMFLLLAAMQLGQDAIAQESWGDSSYDTASYTSVDRRWPGYNWGSSNNLGRDWQLGIVADNTDAGVVVRQVRPGSAADRSGIFPGDVIVCVAGSQVGRVGNQVYDLSTEIRRKADSRGRISMLLLDQRLGQLKPQMIQLDSPATGISGTLTIQDNRRLPLDAVVTVRLENETRPHYQVRNGEASFSLSSYGAGNIPFNLAYDPSYISSRDRYILRAYITSGGRTIYQTGRPTYVLTNGSPTNVQLVLQPAIYQPGGGSGGDIVQAGYVPFNAYRDDIVAAYQRYLRRPPSTLELAAYDGLPDIADRVRRLPVDLMATEEFFSLMGGNTNSWLRAAFGEIIGHAPTSTEMQLWTQRFGELRYSRTELLNQLLMQARG